MVSYSAFALRLDHISGHSLCPLARTLILCIGLPRLRRHSRSHRTIGKNCALTGHLKSAEEHQLAEYQRAPPSSRVARRVRITTNLSQTSKGSSDRHPRPLRFKLLVAKRPAAHWLESRLSVEVIRTDLVDGRWLRFAHLRKLSPQDSGSN